MVGLSLVIHICICLYYNVWQKNNVSNYREQFSFSYKEQKPSNEMNVNVSVRVSDSYHLRLTLESK